MAPIQVKFITAAYDVINTAGNSANAIRKALTTGAMVLDGGITKAIETFLENVVDWFLGKILNDFMEQVAAANMQKVGGAPGM